MDLRVGDSVPVKPPAKERWIAPRGKKVSDFRWQLLSKDETPPQIVQRGLIRFVWAPVPGAEV